MKEQKIHYEPHPVSPERKAELRALGLTIVDIIHKPADHVEVEPESVNDQKQQVEVAEILASGNEDPGDEALTVLKPVAAGLPSFLGGPHTDSDQS